MFYEDPQKFCKDAHSFKSSVKTHSSKKFPHSEDDFWSLMGSWQILDSFPGYWFIVGFLLCPDHGFSDTIQV